MAVHLIAAVGMSGQIGLNGKLPWQDDPAHKQWMAQDLAMFGAMTAGGCLIMGVKTLESLPSTWEPGNRQVYAYSRRGFGSWGGKPAALIAHIGEAFPGRSIWICGGAVVYEDFMPFVDVSHISHSPYDGPADRWMPPIYYRVPAHTMRRAPEHG